MKIRPLVSKNSNYQVLSETKKTRLNVVNIFSASPFSPLLSSTTSSGVQSSFLPPLPPSPFYTGVVGPKKEGKKREGRKEMEGGGGGLFRLRCGIRPARN